MKKLVASVLIALGLSAGAGACSYQVAVAPDNTVYVVENNAFLFGFLSTIYACKNNGTKLECTNVGKP